MGGQRYTPHTAPFYRAHEPKNVPEADRSYGTDSFSQKPRPGSLSCLWDRGPGARQVIKKCMDKEPYRADPAAQFVCNTAFPHPQLGRGGGSEPQSVDWTGGLAAQTGTVLNGRAPHGHETAQLHAQLSGSSPESAAARTRKLKLEYEQYVRCNELPAAVRTAQKRAELSCQTDSSSTALDSLYMEAQAELKNKNWREAGRAAEGALDIARQLGDEEMEIKAATLMKTAAFSASHAASSSNTVRLAPAHRGNRGYGM